MKELEKKEDLVNRPNHYCKYNVELESIDVVDLFSFNLGSCIKYALRFRDKENPVMDLEKALWYARRIENNQRKLLEAVKEIRINIPVLQIYRDKAKDIVTSETIRVLLDVVADEDFSGVILMLENRLKFEKSRAC